MKKILSLFITILVSLAMHAGDLVDYHFSINEYRWAEYRHDFNVSKVYGKGFISIDEDGSGYVYVEWNGNNKNFAFSSRDLVNVDSDDETVRLTYRYGSGEVHIELGRYGAIVHYNYGDKFKIWKER